MPAFRSAPLYAGQVRRRDRGSIDLSPRIANSEDHVPRHFPLPFLSEAFVHPRTCSASCETIRASSSGLMSGSRVIASFRIDFESKVSKPKKLRPWIVLKSLKYDRLASFRFRLDFESKVSKLKNLGPWIASKSLKCDQFLNYREF